MQVILVIADDARGARIYQGFDTRLLTGLYDRTRALDVDTTEEISGDLDIAAGDGRGRVNDDVGAKLFEERS